MSGGDRTGPMGMGPMTGRGMGYCAGYAAPGYMNGPGGMGMGRGRGGGRGWRNRFYATGRPGWMAGGYGGYWPAAPAAFAAPSSVDQTAALKDEIAFLEQSLARTRERLADLEKASAEK